jgi:hypothetical protein
MSMKTFEERVETPRALHHQVPARESGRENKPLRQKALCRHSGIERPHVCEARGAAEKGNSSKQPTQREQPIIFHVRGGRMICVSALHILGETRQMRRQARRCRIGSRHTARGWGQIFRMHCCDSLPMIMEILPGRERGVCCDGDRMDGLRIWTEKPPGFGTSSLGGWRVQSKIEMHRPV